MKRALVAVTAGLAVALAFACRPRPAEEGDPLGPNAACYVCHMTFVKEELSKVHKAAKVSCIKCHGLSAAHANDEDIGATKPDVAFSRGKVNAFCRTCHKTHDAAPGKVVARWQERVASRLPSPKLAPAAVCTDCHGNHKIARRLE